MRDVIPNRHLFHLLYVSAWTKGIIMYCIWQHLVLTRFWMTSRQRRLHQIEWNWSKKNQQVRSRSYTTILRTLPFGLQFHERKHFIRHNYSHSNKFKDSVNLMIWNKLAWDYFDCMLIVCHITIHDFVSIKSKCFCFCQSNLTKV